MNEAAQRQMEKVTQNLIQACDEMSENYRQSVDAVMESTSALAKGCEELSRNFGSLLQEQVAHALNTGKTFMSAKSVKEITDLQAEYIKGFLDQWMAGTGRLSEISARVTQEALTPVAKQANNAIGKAGEQVQRVSRAA